MNQGAVVPEETPLRCPNCRQDMSAREVERHDSAKIRIDICFPCYAIWFDRWESVQLAPGAIIELFKEIHSHKDEMRCSLGSTLACPRCSTSLVFTNDLCKTGRFSYYRCSHDHGRLTPFFQFLREKQFVRILTPAEFNRVRAEIKEVKCSGCGAAIDLERTTCCTYCMSPIAVLDADAVEKAMRIWAEAASQKHQPSPEALSKAFDTLGAIGMPQKRNVSGVSPFGPAYGRFETGADLLEVCIGVIGGIFDSL